MLLEIWMLMAMMVCVCVCVCVLCVWGRVPVCVCVCVWCVCVGICVPVCCGCGYECTTLTPIPLPCRGGHQRSRWGQPAGDCVHILGYGEYPTASALPDHPRQSVESPLSHAGRAHLIRFLCGRGHGYRRELLQWYGLRCRVCVDTYHM